MMKYQLHKRLQEYCGCTPEEILKLHESADTTWSRDETVEYMKSLCRQAIDGAHATDLVHLKDKDVYTFLCGEMHGNEGLCPNNTNSTDMLSALLTVMKHNQEVKLLYEAFFFMLREQNLPDVLDRMHHVDYPLKYIKGCPDNNPRCVYLSSDGALAYLRSMGVVMESLRHLGYHETLSQRMYPFDPREDLLMISPWSPMLSHKTIQQSLQRCRDFIQDNKQTFAAVHPLFQQKILQPYEEYITKAEQTLEPLDYKRVFIDLPDLVCMYTMSHLINEGQKILVVYGGEYHHTHVLDQLSTLYNVDKIIGTQACQDMSCSLPISGEMS